MPKRTVIIARGEVQRVGYRDVVEREARRMNISELQQEVYISPNFCRNEKAALAP